MVGDWMTVPMLGAPPHFRVDPVEGGVPVSSADGRWWWDGRSWTPVLSAAAGRAR